VVIVSNLSKTQNLVVTTDKHLIIGAGFVGLVMAQALQADNIPYRLEAE
jgi:cation diffusion facilitator CzcD-associated flavoprotein CzcO